MQLQSPMLIINSYQICSVHIRVHVPTIVKEVYVKKPVHHHEHHDDHYSGHSNHGSSSGGYGGSSSSYGSGGDDSFSGEIIIKLM